MAIELEGEVVKKMQTEAGRRRHIRIMIWSLVIIVAGTLMLPLTGYVYVSFSGVQVRAAQAENGNVGVNPISNYWRAVRDGDKGYTAASGPYTTSDMIQSQGEEWRQLRNGYVTLGVTVLTGAVLLLIVLFHLIKGPKRLEQTPSGRTLPRWSGGERLLHWYTAILFIVLSITGFSLLFGRAVLIPWMGPEGFAAYANVAKLVHDYAGPLFLVGVILEVITWMGINTFKSYDLEWFRNAGGMFKKGDLLPAGRVNGGEKTWFWFVATIGLLGVGISGVVLDFPNFGQDRETMQIANVIHGALAGLWLAIAFGHIYLGTLGVSGSIRGMVRGTVSEEWMKEHHNLWYEHLKSGAARAQEEKPRAVSRPPRPGPAPLP
ncbi:MAG: formate dehydrogenase subunit gamma [Gammaproteobacteria bacterium]